MLMMIAGGRKPIEASLINGLHVSEDCQIVRCFSRSSASAAENNCSLLLHILYNTKLMYNNLLSFPVIGKLKQFFISRQQPPPLAGRPMRNLIKFNLSTQVRFVS